MTGIRHHHAFPRGFTLIEMLVVIAIISTLIAILLPSLSYARKCAVITGELSAGRQFILAHQMYTNDFDGRLLPGFASGSMIRRGDVIARDMNGKRLEGESARRYPWRLLPYVSYDLGILYRDRDRIEQLKDQTADFHYAVSIAPRMGLNHQFVGGSSESSLHDSPRTRQAYDKLFGKNWCAKRVSQVRQPSKQLVFASADGDDPKNGLPLDGYFRIDPPNFPDRKWQIERPHESTPYGQVGFVTFRFLGKAVTSMLDGHSETLDWEEMQDMRRWAPRATSADWPTADNNGT